MTKVALESQRGMSCTGLYVAKITVKATASKLSLRFFSYLHSPLGKNFLKKPNRAWNSHTQPYALKSSVIYWLLIMVRSSALLVKCILSENQPILTVKPQLA